MNSLEYQYELMKLITEHLKKVNSHQKFFAMPLYGPKVHKAVRGILAAKNIARGDFGRLQKSLDRGGDIGGVEVTVNKAKLSYLKGVEYVAKIYGDAKDDDLKKTLLLAYLSDHNKEGKRVLEAGLGPNNWRRFNFEQSSLKEKYIEY